MNDGVDTHMQFVPLVRDADAMHWESGITTGDLLMGVWCLFSFSFSFPFLHFSFGYSVRTFHSCASWHGGFTGLQIDWNDGIHEVFQFGVWGQGFLSEGISISVKPVLRLALLDSLDCERKQLEALYHHDKGFIGGRGGKDGNHAASPGGFALYQ
ncbi:hypothetical protein V8C44DRAFT_233799 [Trichoderma aethiopicum]